MTTIAFKSYEIDVGKIMSKKLTVRIKMNQTSVYKGCRVLIITDALQASMPAAKMHLSPLPAHQKCSRNIIRKPWNSRPWEALTIQQSGTKNRPTRKLS